MLNPRRKVITPFSRSVKIERTPINLAVTCDKIIPPVAGPITVSIPLSLKYSANSLHNCSVYSGCCNTLNFSTYKGLCNPEVSKKCPSRIAFVSLNNNSTSFSFIFSSPLFLQEYIVLPSVDFQPW